MRSDSKTTCPLCNSQDVVQIKNYDKGMGGMRMYHDRKCAKCGAVWTPATPKWAARTCFVVGVLLLIGFTVLAWVIFEPLTVQGPGDGQELEAKRVGLEAVFASAAILVVPGFGLVLFGLRSSTEPRIQSR